MPGALSVYDAIWQRRDVRGQFTGQPMDQGAFDRVLAAAHAAPSVGLTRPWDFVVITERPTREAFRSHVLEQRTEFAATLPDDAAATFSTIKIEGILEASAGIVVTYDSRRGEPHVLGRHAIADAGLYSTCLAIENLWLAATAEHLGVGWVSFYVEDFLRVLLGIPPEVRPVAWLCIGPVTHLEEVPDLERHRWRERRPVTEAIHSERW